ncbi:MAG: sigma-70 family RNA polymerase sigma factor [Dermatophilaceae bacterium]
MIADTVTRTPASGSITYSSYAVDALRASYETCDGAALFEAVRLGQGSAWKELERRYSRLLWSIANSCRLSEQDAEDVIQTIWLRLLENLDKIREPEGLHQWLAVTARRECWRIAAMARKNPTSLDDQVARTLPDGDQQVDARIIREEQVRCLWHAVGQLPPAHRRLVRALLSTEERT